MFLGVSEGRDGFKVQFPRITYTCPRTRLGGIRAPGLKETAPLLSQHFQPFLTEILLSACITQSQTQSLVILSTIL